MIGFLTLVVIVLGIIAIAQLVRVFELASRLRGRKEEDISRSENKFNATMMLLFVVSFFIYVGYQVLEHKDKLLPVAASEHGAEIDALLNFNFVIIFIVFVVTHIFLFFFAYKYYYREDRVATYFTHSNKLELIWTVIPAIFLAVIIVYGLKTWGDITEPASEDAIVVELYSKQFDWTARYAGEDNQLGRSDYLLIEGINALGVDSADQKAADDIIVKGEFHLPVNKEINFQFRSRDVIHSAYMPHFRVQMNTVPGMVTQFKMTPTKTTEEMRQELNDPEFNYVLLCNKICGSAHYNMQMDIIVESEEDYQKWLSEQQTFIPATQSAEKPAEDKEEENTELAENL